LAIRDVKVIWFVASAFLRRDSHTSFKLLFGFGRDSPYRHESSMALSTAFVIGTFVEIYFAEQFQYFLLLSTLNILKQGVEMSTNLNIDNDLLDEALRLSGKKTKSETVNEAIAYTSGYTSL
jgi:hypothetical protein